jgi:hypothetical protein
MATYHNFSDQAVTSALEAAKRDFNTPDLGVAVASEGVAQSHALSVLAQCIDVTVEDNKICLNLPLGLGSVCIPIPINIPNGQAASACLSLCTTWGIPTGAKVKVIVAGVTIIEQSFGKC